MKSVRVVTRLVVVTLTGIMLHASSLQAESWRLETVEVMLHPMFPFVPLSLALDAHGAPHLAYMGDGRLVHAFKETADWWTEVVDSLPKGRTASSGGQLWTDIINGPGIAAGVDRIHIAYLGNSHGLQCATRTGGLWTYSTIDERASSWMTSLSLRIDDDGHLCLSYGAYPSHKGRLALKYGRGAAGTWHTELVDSTQKASGTHSALVVDNATPHIAISNSVAFQYTVQYATKSRDTWHIETVSHDGGEVVAIALDSTGVPHLAWAAAGVVCHAWRVGHDEWRVEEIPEPAEPTWSLIGIAIDAEDTIHIASVYDAGLRHLVCEEPGRWDPETVDEDAIGATPMCGLGMALDRHGTVYIGYVAHDPDLPGSRMVKVASNTFGVAEPRR